MRGEEVQKDKREGAEEGVQEDERGQQEEGAADGETGLRMLVGNLINICRFNVGGWKDWWRGDASWRRSVSGWSRDKERQWIISSEFLHL